MFLIRKGLKQGTVKRHVWQVKRFKNTVGAINTQNVEKHVIERLESGIKKKTVNNLLCALRRYGEFVDNDKLQKLKLFKPEKSVKKILNPDELDKVLNLPAPTIYSKKIYDRFTLFYKILAFTGMRPNELASLTVEDVDFGRGVFEIPDSKTNNPRNVPIPENVEDEVREICDKSDSLLFTTLQGNKVTADSWGSNFNRRLKRLGLKRKGLTCYSLRHSFITAMLDEDVNLFKVQKIVGHKQITTTAQYTHLTTKDIKKAIRSHPLVKKARKPEEKLEAFLEVAKEMLGEDFYINEGALIKSFTKKKKQSVKQKNERNKLPLSPS